MKITKVLSAATLAALAAPAALAIATAPAAQANTSQFLTCLSSHGVTGDPDFLVWLGHHVYLELEATYPDAHNAQAKALRTPGV
ncbi:MAG: hypothetical protein ACLP3C_03745 [Mycobacterium sp.]|uniref:hypothetical protein n=1 Tax=Mycobacterium sp. TaxID=1785 RepID=UPI003F9D5938